MKLVRPARLALRFIAIILVMTVGSCAESKRAQNGPHNAMTKTDSVVTDKNGTSYRVKLMADGNLWMTSNLRTNIPGSYCYDDNVANCERYGRLYTWKVAPEGCRMLGNDWRLPTVGEWQNMAALYGMAGKDSNETRKKAFYPLLYSGISQFNAVLGGGRNLDGTYARLEAHGFYWTATASDSAMAWFANFAKGSQSLYHQPDGEMARAFSVRCIKSASGGSQGYP